MEALRRAFHPWPRSAAAAAVALGGAEAFLRFALPAPHPFAAAALSLLLSAILGPFLVTGAVTGLLRCGALAALAALLCRSPLLGLFSGLYAFAAGAVADLFRAKAARLLAAAAAAALLGTLLYWDALGSGKEHAALGFRLSALAAASVTIDFDWVHAKALYTNNFAAESLAGVERPGIGPFSLRCAAVAAVALALGRVAPWRS
jgi:hypothetical protein